MSQENEDHANKEKETTREIILCIDKFEKIFVNNCIYIFFIFQKNRLNYMSYIYFINLIFRT